MKKRIWTILVLCVLLSGCGGGPKSNAKHTEGSPETRSDHSSASSAAGSEESEIRDSESVKFRYSAPQTEQISVDRYRYADMEVSRDSFRNLFSGQPEEKREEIPNGFREEYALGEENGVIMEHGGALSVHYNTSRGGGYFSVEYDTQSPDERTEFDFISREEMSGKLASTVNALLGIKIRVTAIDAITAERFSKDVEEHINALAELYDNLPDAGKYGTPADFYLVTFVQTVENVPVTDTFGHAIFTAEGMEYLDIVNPVSVGEKETVSDPFIRLDGAENLLKAKYDLIFLDKPIEVESAELTYIVSGGELMPAWEFTLADGIVEYYDAYTGKEIVFNRGVGA